MNDKNGIIIEDNSKKKKIFNDINERLGNFEKEKANQPPPGYIPMELSTKGKMGAPKIFHIRNFDTKDIANLALTDQYDLPEKVCQMLDNLIFEKNCSVLVWHEKEVVELLVRLFMAYFTNVLTEMEFPVDDSDYQFLAEKLGADSDEYKTKVADLKLKRWIPRTDIDLKKAETYDIPDNFKSSVNIKSEKTGFTLRFSYPRFGDVITIKKFIDEEYKEQDKRFAKIRQMLDFKRSMEERYQNGEDIDLSRVPGVPEAEVKKYRDYEAEKALYSIDAIRALHLDGFDGKNVKDLPLAERIRFVQDPRFDINVTSTVEKYFESLEFGLKPEVEMFNPIKGIVEKRRFPFRLIHILSAVKLYKSVEYVISTDDEGE
jgi:hypothetical protein